MTILSNMPFWEHRNHDGTFKRWLHTWYSLQLAFESGEYMAPLPWVWDAKYPDGELLLAMKTIGVLKHCPMGWPNFAAPPTNLQVNAVILQHHSRAAWVEWYHDQGSRIEKTVLFAVK